MLVQDKQVQLQRQEHRGDPRSPHDYQGTITFWVSPSTSNEKLSSRFPPTLKQFLLGYDIWLKSCAGAENLQVRREGCKCLGERREWGALGCSHQPFSRTSNNNKKFRCFYSRSKSRCHFNPCVSAYHITRPQSPSPNHGQPGAPPYMSHWISSMPSLHKLVFQLTFL